MPLLQRSLRTEAAGCEIQIIITAGQFHYRGGRICRSGTYWLSSLCKVRKKVGETGDHNFSAHGAIGMYYCRF